jgi:hypothetical protein
MGTTGAAGVRGYDTNGTSAVSAAVEGCVGADTEVVVSAAGALLAVVAARGLGGPPGAAAAPAAAVLEPILTVRERLGTPAAFIPKTIQLPGTATPGSVGTTTEYVKPEVAVQVLVALPQSSMRR